MSHLYTSQVHLKRLLGGQATAAFTPLPDEVQAIIDPAFVPGMGALNEDEEGRLQCPVRECGTFHHDLGAHVGATHPQLKARGVRAALGIPQTAALTTRRKSGVGRDVAHMRAMRTLQPKASSKRGKPGLTYMTRNFADTCPAQLQAKIESLAERLGRSPTSVEFRAEFGANVADAIRAVFGSWTNAVNTAGLHARVGGPTPIVPQEHVIDALQAWCQVHGDLPTSTDCKLREQAPILPTYPVILRAFGASSWQAAMREALRRIDVDSVRYGYLKDSRTARAA